MHFFFHFILFRSLIFDNSLLFFQIFLEQKKMLKTGLNIARFRQHIPMIEEETIEYFKRWGNSGERGQWPHSISNSSISSLSFFLDLFKAMSELVILTASHCLHGPEIRSIMDEKVAQLYWDMDGGFSAEAWLLPSWVPLPSFRYRNHHCFLFRIINQRPHRKILKTNSKFIFINCLKLFPSYPNLRPWILFYSPQKSEANYANIFKFSNKEQYFKNSAHSWFVHVNFLASKFCERWWVFLYLSNSFSGNETLHTRKWSRSSTRPFRKDASRRRSMTICCKRFLNPLTSQYSTETNRTSLRGCLEHCFFVIFRTGRHLTDDEIAGMMIGLLLAGQHTSSTTSTWMAFFLAQNKQLQVAITSSYL